ncbi:MAG: MOSC domain-containing protein [Chloroflexota bacterium]
MAEGKVVSINIAPAATAPMLSVSEVRAIAGEGLEGDRYAKKEGTFSKLTGTGREVTLIEVEAVLALGNEYGVELKPGDARRNIVTEGVALHHMVGREFNVGEVTLRGMRLCEPCSHLEKLTEKGAMRGLIHRGGLRAEIVTGGTIRVGDSVE